MFARLRSYFLQNRGPPDSFHITKPNFVRIFKKFSSSSVDITSHHKKAKELSDILGTIKKKLESENIFQRRKELEIKLEVCTPVDPKKHSKIRVETYGMILLLLQKC